MLFQSAHVRVSTDDGIGTVWLTPPGGRVGAGVLTELLTAAEMVANTPGVEVLVLRSGTPTGFGRGLDPGSNTEELVGLGQRVTAVVAALPMPSVAFVEGPCVGPGLELALACDFRLAVAGPDSWVGFGELPPGWGGRTRLRQLTAERLAHRLSAREAVRAGVFDDAFCERRGKIELRTWLDRLQFDPAKRAAGWRSWFVNAEAGFAEERKAFRAAVRAGVLPVEVPPATRPLRRVGLLGNGPATRWLAAEWSMRGVEVVWVAGARDGVFADALRRGRLTPLEAEQAGRRVVHTDDADRLSLCDWLTLTDPHTDLAARLEHHLPPRVVLGVPPAHLERVAFLAARPSRVVGFTLKGEAATVVEHDGADADTTAAVVGWLGQLGGTAAVGPLPKSAPALLTARGPG